MKSAIFLIAFYLRVLKGLRALNALTVVQARKAVMAVIALMTLMAGCKNTGPLVVDEFVDSDGLAFLNDEVAVNQGRLLVYLFIGHSNLAGAVLPDTASHPRVWNFQLPEETYRYQSFKWRPLVEAPHVFKIGQIGTGPAKPLLISLAKHYPQFHFGALQNAHASATLENHYAKNGELFRELMKGVRKIQDECTIAGVVAMFGIPDASHELLAKNFKRNYQSLIKNLRDSLRSPRLPFYIGELEKGDNYKDWNYGPKIDKAIKDIAKADRNVFMISNEGVSYDDGHHYDLRGHEIWSQRVFETISRYKKVPSIKSDTTKPSKPGGPYILSYKNDSILLNWTPSIDSQSFISSYQIQYKSNTAHGIYSSTAHQLMLPISSLDTLLEVSVQAINEDGIYSDKSISGINLNREEYLHINDFRIDTLSESYLSLHFSLPEYIEPNTIYANWNDSIFPIETDHVMQMYSKSNTFHLLRYADDEKVQILSDTLFYNIGNLKYATNPLRVNFGGDSVHPWKADKEWELFADYGFSNHQSGTKYDSSIMIRKIPKSKFDLHYAVESSAFVSLGHDYNVRLKKGLTTLKIYLNDYWFKEPEFDFYYQVNPNKTLEIFQYPAAGTACQLIEETFYWDGGVLSMNFVADTHGPMLNALEIYQDASLLITSPQNHFSASIGDTLAIEWNADIETIQDVVIAVFVHEKWQPISLGSIPAETQEFNWIVPKKINRKKLANSSIQIKVYDYLGEQYALVSGNIN